MLCFKTSPNLPALYSSRAALHVGNIDGRMKNDWENSLSMATKSPAMISELKCYRPYHVTHIATNLKYVLTWKGLRKYHFLRKTNKRSMIQGQVGGYGWLKHLTKAWNNDKEEIGKPETQHSLCNVKCIIEAWLAMNCPGNPKFLWCIVTIQCIHCLNHNHMYSFGSQSKLTYSWEISLDETNPCQSMFRRLSPLGGPIK